MELCCDNYDKFSNRRFAHRAGMARQDGSNYIFTIVDTEVSLLSFLKEVLQDKTKNISI